MAVALYYSLITLEFFGLFKRLVSAVRHEGNMNQRRNESTLAVVHACHTALTETEAYINL